MDVKTHIKEHKEAYIIGGICLGIGVLAGITWAIVRSNTAQRGVSECAAQLGNANTASFTFRSPQTINITTVVDRDGRGHPGWPVRNLEMNRIFFSQREAASAFDISEGALSGHLQGKYPDVAGLHFERVNLKEAI